MPQNRESSYEEATHCPKCQTPGEVVSKAPAKGIPGAQIHTVYCRNEVCRWFNTFWVVQVNADGTVREYDHSKDQKVYQGFEDHDRRAKAVLDALARQNEVETKPGGEIRGPGQR